MKTLVFLCCCLGVGTLASAQITMTLYEADSITLFDFRDIMVGTKLTVVVESASAISWCGGLFVSMPDTQANPNLYWKLIEARGLDPDPNNSGNSCGYNRNNGLDWADSHLSQAGSSASVISFGDSDLWGFDLQSDNTASSGKWFIFDYFALDTGQPTIGLYDFNTTPPFWPPDPIQTLTVSQVRTRDFNDDGDVNYVDFSLINANWMTTNCQDPNWCDQADIDRDGNTNLVDLDMFIDFWLVGI